VDGHQPGIPDRRWGKVLGDFRSLPSFQIDPQFVGPLDELVK
jgi:hypothetical protein